MREGTSQVGPSVGDRLLGIQALRAVAVGLVLLLHIHENELRASMDPLLSVWVRHGGGGVDLFFVISGFVMVWITSGERGARTAGAFVFSRVTRIYPAVWLFTTLAILGFALSGTLAEWASSENRILFSYLLLPHELPPVLGVSWTVVYELYFYAVFTLFLLLPARALPIGLGAWALIVLVGSLAGWTEHNPWSAVAFDPLTFEFIAGALVAMALTAGPAWRPRGVLAAGIAWGFAAIIWWGTKSMEFTIWPRVLVYGPAAVAIVYGVAGLELAGRLRAPRWLTALGDMSYSFYLSHLLVIATLAHLWMRFERPGPVDNVLMIAAMVVAPLVLAALTYVGFERPLVRLAHRVRKRLFAPPPVVGAASPETAG